MFDFVNGEVLLIDKPLTWTSFDVVNKVRFMVRDYTGVKKIKVGHAGTLDPLATGLLIICTGKFTKRINEFMGLDKVYTGTMRLGETTPSFDAETEVSEKKELSIVNSELSKYGEKYFEPFLEKFRGDIQQVPPIYSATRVDGKKAYEYARKQKEVVIQPKDVTIHKFVLTRVELPEVYFEVRCTKGTYIRSLAHDLGQALGVGAYLTSLRRTKIGDFDLDESLKLEQLKQILDFQKNKN